MVPATLNSESNSGLQMKNTVNLCKVSWIYVHMYVEHLWHAHRCTVCSMLFLDHGVWTKCIIMSVNIRYRDGIVNHFTYLCLSNQKIVAHPKPVARLIWELGCGNEVRKSLLQRPSCHVISWLMSFGLNMWTLSVPNHSPPNKVGVIYWGNVKVWKYGQTECKCTTLHEFGNMCFKTLSRLKNTDQKNLQKTMIKTCICSPEHNPMHLSRNSDSNDFL